MKVGEERGRLEINKVLALQAVDPSLIPSTVYGSPSPAGSGP